MNITRALFCRWQSQLTPSVRPTIAKSYLLQHLKNTARPQNSFRSIRNSAQNDRAHATPFETIITGGSVPPNNVIKAAIFTGAFAVGTFMGASVLEYENTRSMMYEKVRQAKFAWLRRKSIANNQWEELKHTVKHYWNNLTPGEKVFVPLCALNFIVYGLWRVPSMRNVMLTYFTSNPAAQAVCWPMFLSTFSHYNFLHLAANMYVLHSFSNAAVLSLGKEQFLAVYLSAGVFASLASIMYKAAVAQAGFSIGASGAIMAILAYVCTQYPDTRLSILFLPTLTFSAGTAIKVIMGLDFAGCLLGWKFFDHAAHLGGAVAGVYWAYFGNEVWQKRLPFLQFYHDLRKTK